MSQSGVPATARPTFAHEGDFNFTWGFHPNFDLTILVPVVTNRFEMMNSPTTAGTGLGDAMALVKHRFYRRDSQRGTTQASFTIGPKVPTGRTDLRSRAGNLLPASLQPGSGSADLFLSANWTYTGLFNIRRLVADEDIHSFIRSQGTQRTRLGDDIEARFWFSYRPYESKNVAREWFIGPVLTWLHSQDDRIGGIMQTGSGGDVLQIGATSYVGLRPDRVAPRNAYLGRDGLGRGPFHGDVLHARATSYQSWDHTAVSAASLKRRKNYETTRTCAVAISRELLCASFASSSQAYRNAGRRHDMKLLSLRCETAPTTPAWRCQC